ncbi:hypothetical protein ElyMa_006184700 [Elysia marginata]|uniref:Uncharacterized protein n=1 Tax=Elysia marginata TaxID=1093978 RepID=A0AAV4H599_9GAST|nr:hypothetical protein ElyMa_006184700 [Elysia marginata]
MDSGLLSELIDNSLARITDGTEQATENVKCSLVSVVVVVAVVVVVVVVVVAVVVVERGGGGTAVSCDSSRNGIVPNRDYIFIEKLSFVMIFRIDIILAVELTSTQRNSIWK